MYRLERTVWRYAVVNPNARTAWVLRQLRVQSDRVINLLPPSSVADRWDQELADRAAQAVSRGLPERAAAVFTLGTRVANAMGVDYLSTGSVGVPVLSLPFPSAVDRTLRDPSRLMLIHDMVAQFLLDVAETQTDPIAGRLREAASVAEGRAVLS